MMKKLEQEKKPNMDGVNLLVSILVCYPEIGTISIEPKDDSLKMTFVLGKVPETGEFEATKEFILNSILTYHTLEGLGEAEIQISLNQQDSVAFINILRDMNTISKGEIALISTLMKEHFGTILVSDANEEDAEEADMIQDEFIDHMIGSMKINHTSEKLVGIREDGRVMVFNK